MFPNSIIMNPKNFSKKPQQPVIKIEMSMADIIVEAIIWALILGFWTYTIVIYGKLPENIPSHFNELGEATNYEQKVTLFLLPSISTIVVIILSTLNQKPHIFNYPFKITETNARNQYYLGIKMIRTLKLCLVVEFLLISLYMSEVSLGNIQSLGKLSTLFIPFLMAIIIAPIIYYIAQMYRFR
ncbi:MAG: DUF1648 domain-containing protein [Bacteroidales bacterium]|nr:MAG: DUF1648 domain-containing protein [Bacteroidales bacterium]